MRSLTPYLPHFTGTAIGAVGILLYGSAVLRTPVFLVDQQNTAAPDSVLTLHQGQRITQQFSPTRRATDRLTIQYLPPSAAVEAPDIALTLTAGTQPRERIAGTLDPGTVAAPPDDPEFQRTPRAPAGSRWLQVDLPSVPTTDEPLTFEIIHRGAPGSVLTLPYQHDATTYRNGHLTVNGAARKGNLAFTTYTRATPWERLTDDLVTQSHLIRVVLLVLGSLTVTLGLQLAFRWRHTQSLLPSPPLVFFAVIALTVTLPFFFTTTAWGIHDWTEAIAHYRAARQSFAAGEFPFWSPFFCGGAPLWAAPQAYWPSLTFLLTLIFGDLVGTKVASAVIIFLGLWGMERLARQLRLSPAAALIPPLVFVLSGFFTSHLAVGQLLWLTIAWVPWVLVFFLRSQDRPWLLIPTAGFFLLIVFEGRLHIAAYLTLLLPFLGLATLQKTADVWRLFRRLATLVVLIVTLGAVKILPTLEFIRETPNVVPLTAGTPWTKIPEVLLTRSVTSSLSRSWTSLPWHEHSAYIGIVPLLLAVAGGIAVFRTKRMLGIALLASALVFLLFTTSADGATVFSVLPFVQHLRNPARAIGMVLLVLAILAGVGTDALLRRVSPARRGPLAFSLALFIALDLGTTAFPALRETFTQKPAGFDGQGNQFYQDGGHIDIAHHVIAAGYGARNYCPVSLRTFNPLAAVWARGDHAYQGEVYAARGTPAEIIAFSPNRLVIRVTGVPKEGDTVFLNQRYERSWRSPDRTVRSDEGRIAFPVFPRDNGRPIELFYQPASARAGAAISLAALLACVGVFFWHRRARGQRAG